MTRRRTFVGAIAGGLLIGPLAAHAQSGRVWRLGYLTTSSTSPEEVAHSPTFAAFLQRLRELRYVEGKNIAFEVRNAGGDAERLRNLADELVRRKVDLIVAPGNPAVEAAARATSTIPILMLATSDPVASGFVAKLARPGGNITGLTIQTPDLNDKIVQLLKEALPGLTRVAVLWDPRFFRGRLGLNNAEAAAARVGLQVYVAEWQDPSRLKTVLEEVSRSRSGALWSIGGNAFDERTRIAELAIQHKVPTIAAVLEYAEAGYLMAYGASLRDQWTRAADFVDRIFKGGKPAEIPVEQPTKFALAVNLRTAKAIGVTIPAPLRSRAEQVIE